MPKYDVHIFAVVRVKVPNVEASNRVQACKRAEDRVDFYGLLRQDHPQACVEDMEYAEETSHYLVDVVGDIDYEKSKWLCNNYQEMSDKHCSKCGSPYIPVKKKK